jgi:hypothetical protein
MLLQKNKKERRPNHKRRIKLTVLPMVDLSTESKAKTKSRKNLHLLKPHQQMQRLNRPKRKEREPKRMIKVKPNLLRTLIPRERFLNIE